MPAACGASSTFGKFSSGEPAGGSASKTSRPAPARRPEVSASQSAASSISPPRAVLIRKARGLHQCELAPPDQMARLRRERGVQRDDVGFAQQLVQGHQLDAGGGGERPVRDRIGGQQPHLERSRPPRHRLADPAEPDDPQAAAPEPRMEAAAPAPGRRPGRGAAKARPRDRSRARRRSRPRSRDWCRRPSPRPRHGGSRRRRRPGRSRRRSGRPPAARAPRRTPARCTARHRQWSRTRPAGARSARPRSTAAPARSSRSRSPRRATARGSLPAGHGAVGCCTGPCSRSPAPRCLSLRPAPIAIPPTIAGSLDWK